MDEKEYQGTSVRNVRVRDLSVKCEGEGCECERV